VEKKQVREKRSEVLDLSSESNEGKPPAVVLGGSATGLGAVKWLAKDGVKVYVVDSNPKVTCFYSSQCEKRLSPGTDKVDDAVEYLVSLGREIGQRAVLFSTSDGWSLVVARGHKKLKEYYSYDFISEQEYLRLEDKREQYRIAEKVGVDYPKTAEIKKGKNEAEEMKNAGEAAAGLRFPVLVKPIDAADFFNKFYSKGFVSRSAEEAADNYKKAKRAGFECVLQEIIEGPETELYSFVSYIDSKGELKRSFMAHKIRQYPPHFGTCTLGESVYVPEIIEPSLRLLNEFNFSGPSQVEYKRGKDGKYYLMEINPRIWLWHSLSGYCGASIINAAYDSLIGKPVEKIEKWRTGIKWWDMEKDWVSFRMRSANGEMGFLEWVGSLRGEKEQVWFNSDDPLLLARKIGAVVKRRVGLA